MTTEIANSIIVKNKINIKNAKKFVLLKVICFEGYDMINYLYIENTGNETAIKTLAELLNISYKNKEYSENRIKKRQFTNDGHIDSFRVFIMSGLIKTLTIENYLTNEMLGDMPKNPKWNNICDKIEELYVAEGDDSSANSI